MIGLVTDSNAQLPPELIERYHVEVVPLSVIVDGETFLEGVDLDADGFYARFEGGGRPEVSTAQPSPGRFAQVFEELAGRGVTEILAVHVGSSVSGTLNSARLAAADSPVPVRIVDTGTASFGVACCVWEAGEVLGAGGTLDEAATVAEGVGETVGTVFTVGALDLAQAGGRLAAGAGGSGEGIPVLTMEGGQMRVLSRVDGLAGAVEAMVEVVVAASSPVGGRGLRVAVGTADLATAPLAQALEERLAVSGEVRELVRYRIGPSVGAHTGPGTSGVFFYPAGSYLPG
ncbi:MAG: DegV family protein [Actinomycetota bacterium]|nr:DegV family protein [Actinomycetota bacterium]